MTSDRALLFARPARLTDESRMALEDYARAAASTEDPAATAETIEDDGGLTLGVRLASSRADPARLRAEIEGFFESLVESAPDRLGWR